MAAGAVLALAACTPPHPHSRSPLRTISALDCPSEEGDLKLQGAATPRQCAYTADDGASVTLQLVDLNGGDARAALASVEQAVNAEAPEAVRPPPTPSPGDAAAAASGSGDWDTKNSHERADIDLPGLHIHSQGSGRADVDVGGVHVTAHDHGQGHDDAHVVVDGGHGGVTVDAHDGGAQVRIQESGKGVRLAYFLESEQPGPHGYRVAGYEARGPNGGPVVVAQVLSKERDDDDLRHDARALLRRNVGG
jgi:hypothetical protein